LGSASGGCPETHKPIASRLNDRFSTSSGGYFRFVKAKNLFADSGIKYLVVGFWARTDVTGKIAAEVSAHLHR
jgi:hypothetical protein